MTIKLRSILFGVILLAAFTERIVLGGVLAGFDLRTWHILLLVSTMIVVMKGKLAIPIEIKYIFSFLVLHSLFVFLVVGELGLFTLVQIVLFTLTTTSLYSLVRYNGITQTLKAYQLAGIFLSVFIIIESLLYVLFGIFIYNTALVGPFIKARGILSEPSQAAVLIAPAILSTLVWKQRVRTGLLLMGVILSFSSLALIAMISSFVIYAIFIFTRNRYKFSVIPAILIAIPFILIFSAIPTVQSRLEGSILSADIIASGSGDTGDYQALGGSVATLALNSQVAAESLFNTYGLGVGFGNFRLAFEKYGSKIVDINSVEGVFYNQTGGGSLLIRSVAELGILGPIIMLVIAIWIYRQFIFYSKLSLQSTWSHNNLIALGMGLITLIAFLIRKDMWFSFNLSLILGLVLLSAPEKHPRSIWSRADRLCA